MKKMLALILAIVMTFSMVACQSNNANSDSNVADTNTSGDSGNSTQETFKVGINTSVAGYGAQYGIDAISGLEIAIDQINAEGGFNGVPVEYVFYDDQYTAEECVKVAQKYIQTEKVNAVLSSNISSLGMAACPLYNKAGVLTMFMGNTSTLAEQNWDYVYRAAMNTADVMPVCEDLMASLGIKTFAVARSQDDNAISSANDFIREAEADGIELLLEEAFASSDTDFSGQCARIVAKDPDCVLISISGDANGLFVKQLRGAGFTGLIFSKESFSESMIGIAGIENSNYVACATPYLTYATPEDCDIPAVREFLERHVEKTGSCNLTNIAYIAYDAMMVLWEASKIAGSNDTEALREAIGKISDLQGLGGTLDYTSGDHEGYHTYNGFILVDGKNQQFSEWVANGGYDAYKAATGNDK